MKQRFILCCVFMLATHGYAAVVRSAASGAWSAAATWENGTLPAAGDVVQVRTGHAVTYDVASENVLRAVHVAGTLSFARDRDTLLCVGLVKVQPGDDLTEDGFDCHGPTKSVEGMPPAILEVGTTDAPIPAEHTATIRLTYIEGMNRESCPALVSCGGRMELHGAPLERTWQKLGYQTPIIEHRTIPMPRLPAGWRPGDRLLFPGTGQGSPTNEHGDDGSYTGHLLLKDTSRSEVRTLKSAKDWDYLEAVQLVTIDRPLKFNHDVLERWQGEVANLSRNVVVESADPKGERGHTMYHRGSSGSLSYVEFRHLGKRGVLGRYPVHFHLTGDSMRGSSVIGCSVWDSDNRAITLHGTQYLVVRDNVAFDIKGHAFFLEDGTETRNILDRNLVCLVHQAAPLPDQTLAFDMNTGSGFWWANSLNVFTRNVAAECDHDGYRLEAVRTKLGPPRAMVRQADGSASMRDLRTVPFIRFEQNEAHRMRLFGLNLNGFTEAPASAEARIKELGVAEDAEGVGPDIHHRFHVRDFRCWDAHWVFHNGSWNTEIDGLDAFRSVHGLWRPMGTGQVWSRLRFDMVDSAILFPRWNPTELVPKDARQYGTEEPIVDDLPPSTVITHVHVLPGGEWSVKGSVAEDGRVTQVSVNGVSASSVRDQFAEWEAVVPPAPDGRISAFAVDAAGNREATPHELRFSTATATASRNAIQR